jgi:hypothetical protein
MMTGTSNLTIVGLNKDMLVSKKLHDLTIIKIHQIIKNLRIDCRTKFLYVRKMNPGDMFGYTIADTLFGSRVITAPKKSGEFQQAIDMSSIIHDYDWKGCVKRVEHAATMDLNFHAKITKRCNFIIGIQTNDMTPHDELLWTKFQLPSHYVVTLNIENNTTSEKLPLLSACLERTRDNIVCP